MGEKNGLEEMLIKKKIHSSSFNELTNFEERNGMLQLKAW